MEQIFVNISVNELVDKVKQAILPEIKKMVRPEKDENELLNRNQIAEILGKTHVTITRMIENGKLNATSDFMVTRKELDRYLQNK